MTQEEPNPLMRKKKTPEELAAEAEAEEEDEITSTCRFKARIREECVADGGEERNEGVEANFCDIRGGMITHTINTS